MIVMRSSKLAVIANVVVVVQSYVRLSADKSISTSNHMFLRVIWEKPSMVV